MLRASPHAAPGRPALAVSLLSLALLAPASVASHAQSDAGVAGDAGDTRATARALTPYGLYEGELAAEPGDEADVYAFPVAAGDPVNIEIRGALGIGGTLAPDNERRASFRLLDPNGVVLDTPLSNQGDARVTLASAPVAGTYYFEVAKPGFEGTYGFCFVVVSGASHSCPDVGHRPIGTLLSGALPQTHVEVLLVPPMHGDLGNPSGGPTREDYLNATLDAVHQWNDSIAAFVDDHPEYSYLENLTVHVQVHDGVSPTAGVDAVVAFVESGGPAFRGLAGPCVSVDPPRCVVLSLFSASPRGGQLLPDYPEVNDIYTVTLHEFGHVFGIGHTLTWDATLGPDLMNSPATFVYGDGDPLGDGGERTPEGCLSSLDLYALAELYAWIPGGSYTPASASSFSLPASVAYARYC